MLEWYSEKQVRGADFTKRESKFYCVACKLLNLKSNARLDSTRYESDVIGSGLANQISNPDVDVDITKPDIVIRSQIAVLKEMTSRLKAAHSGVDITAESGEGG